MTYKIFDTLQEYNDFTLNGTHLTAGTLYLVKENKSLYFSTNNIDGEAEKYEYLDEIPEGYIKPEGNIIITENGEEIDISTYATASVNVPIPEGYIIPTGNKTITQNGENIDVAQYATATVNVDAPAKDYIVEGAEYDPTATYTGIFSGNEYIKSINIPEGFTSIGSDGYSTSLLKTIVNLENLTIPNTVTSIGNDVFHRSFTIDTLTIPDSVTTIGYRMLNNGDSTKEGGVKNIVIGSGLSSVAQYNSDYRGFFGEGCTRRCETIKVSPNNTTYDSRDNCNAIIETATNTLLAGCNGTVIPSSVTAIKEYAFNNCYTLPSITIPDGVTSIGDYAFQSCTSLTSVTIGTGVTSIGDYAFYGCSALTTINIPDGVTSIGSYAFSGCSALTTINIPDGVTSIGSYAFQGCRNANITILATTPPTLAANGFGPSYSRVKIIYVPAESVKAYKTATNWSSYASIIQPIS